MQPVFYIAEGPSISGGAIAIALLILLVVVAAVVALLVLGCRSFFRFGDRPSSATLVPVLVVAVVDLVVVAIGVRRGLFYAFAFPVMHLAALWMGQTGPGDPTAVTTDAVEPGDSDAGWLE